MANLKGIVTSCFDGADERIRTADLLITNQLLYQLSYIGGEGRGSIRNAPRANKAAEPR